MKYVLILCSMIVLSCLLVSCHSFLQKDDRPIETKMAFKMAREIIDDAQEEDNLYVSSISEAGPKGKYKNLGLGFGISKILTKEEGRGLIVKYLHKMLEKFNGNPVFSQYIENGKFTFEDLDVGIISYPKDGSTVYYPDIVTFSFFGGNLWYYTHAPNVRGYYTREKESYEEALHLANQTSSGKVEFSN